MSQCNYDKTNTAMTLMVMNYDLILLIAKVIQKIPGYQSDKETKFILLGRTNSYLDWESEDLSHHIDSSLHARTKSQIARKHKDHYIPRGLNPPRCLHCDSDLPEYSIQSNWPRRFSNKDSPPVEQKRSHCQHAPDFASALHS